MGCTGLMVMALVMLYSVLWMLSGSTPLPPAEGFVGRQTVAFAIVNLDDQDPGIRSLLKNTVDTVWNSLLARSPLPTPLRSAMGEMRNDAASVWFTIHNVLPVQLVITWDELARPSGAANVPAPVASSTPPASLAASLRGTPAPQASPAAQAVPHTPSQVEVVPTFVLSLGHMRWAASALVASLRPQVSAEIYHHAIILNLSADRRPDHAAWLGHLASVFGATAT